MKSKQALLFFFLLAIALVSCEDDEMPADGVDSFDRKVMLENWADNIIVPAFESYSTATEVLVDSKEQFLDEPSPENFESLRADYVKAYTAWQHVAIFDIGKAEAIGLRNFTNIFPTDTEEINTHVTSGTYNLELPSTFDSQGFPALDYMLFGLSTSDDASMQELLEGGFEFYMSDVVDRLHALGDEVLQDWNGGFRDAFVSNDGSSGTASTDKLVNDYLFYYERFLRAGKIGIPAGVFSGNTIPGSVEAPYSKIHTKTLFNAGFEATQKFFRGTSFDGNSEGSSLEDFLSTVASNTDFEGLSADIFNQWQAASSKADLLGESFLDQVTTDNSLMLQTYDELQLAVPLLKVDMMQALNIQVDFVDADGD